MSLNSVFRLTKAAFPDLKASRGVILNIASMYGHIGPDYRIYDGKEFANLPSTVQRRRAYCSLRDIWLAFFRLMEFA